jgi:hypothetical protein
MVAAPVGGGGGGGGGACKEIDAGGVVSLLECMSRGASAGLQEIEKARFQLLEYALRLPASQWTPEVAALCAQVTSHYLPNAPANPKHYLNPTLVTPNLIP